MKGIGTVLAGIWFIGTGLIALLGLRFQGIDLVMGAIALVAGLLLVLRR